MADPKSALGMEILQNCQIELYHYFPFLDAAFTELHPDVDNRQKTIASDGEKLFFSPDFLLESFQRDPVYPVRGLLHILLHCLYLHIFPEISAEEDPQLWDLACDIFVEAVIEAEKIQELELPTQTAHGVQTMQKTAENRLPGTVRQADKNLHLIRERCFRTLQNSRQDSLSLADFSRESGGACSAAQIYRLLKEGRFSDSAEALLTAFSYDDHSLWYESIGQNACEEKRKRWEKVRAYVGGQHARGKQTAGKAVGEEEEMICIEADSRHDYREFLKQFSFTREELELDPESFDYIYYQYGMEHYLGIPLIEPLEYREVSKLGELVIAIDTSGSCSADIIRQFLAETYGMLSDRENFFHRLNLHILQCDCCLQDVTVVHTPEEWTAYLEHFCIYGRGGTDFRPVFRYVDEKIRDHTFADLKALIYFTDGDGVFPGEKPGYETLFVSLKEKARPDLIPVWAKSLTV